MLGPLSNTLTDPQVIEARTIVTHPEIYAGNIGLLTIAWATLKSARGQTMRQSNVILAQNQFHRLQHQNRIAARRGALS